MAQKVLEHDNPLTDRLKSSPYRIEGEKRLQEEYDRVKDTFLVERRESDGTVKQGPGTRSKWYKGDLFQLARNAEKEAEYHTFVAVFSGCVHSSAFAVTKGPMVSPSGALFLASTFTARVAMMNVRYNQLEIGEDQKILEEFCNSLLDQE